MSRILSIALLLLPFAGFSQCSVSLGDDILQCNGAPVTLMPISSGTDGVDSLRIEYDATQGVTGLVGAPQVYFHSGIQTVPFGGWEYTVGNWGANDGIGEMTQVGTNLWQMTIHVESYYGYPGGTNVIGLWMVFRNADGSAEGKDNNGGDIFLETSNSNASTFGGVTGTDIPGSEGSFSWSTGAQTETISVSQSGTYTVTFTDGVGCQATDQIEVEFGNGNVIVDLGPDTSLCDGETIILDAGAGFTSYLWSTSETTQTLEVSLPGDYSVTVTDALGCTGIDLVNISTGTSPTADFSYTSITGTTMEFMDSSSTATTVYWDFDGDGNIDETVDPGTPVQYDFGSESVFGVTMIAENGCGTDTTSQNVLVQDVSVEELKNEIGFSIYPNPTSDIVTMSIADQQVTVSGIELLDLKGRKVVQITATGMNLQVVETSKLSTGTYVLQVITNRGIITERIIKQ
jgi:hypothetical protein